MPGEQGHSEINPNALYQDAQNQADFLLQAKLAELWTKIQNRRYFVYVGAISWAQFDFELHPLAVSIILSDQGFLRDLNPTTISFEIFARMPNQNNNQGVFGIDPAVQAAMKRDVRGVISQLRCATYPNRTDNLVTRFQDGSDSMQDVSDAVAKLQGVVATLTIEY